jgi:ribose/xylose/arabinose/galactoside ABC-type transport system permease subunit
MNSRGYPVGEATDMPVVSFFAFCKYPPEFAYVCFTLSVDLFLLFALSFVPATSLIAEMLLVYGQSSLFFYVVHFWMLSAIARIIEAMCGQPNGVLLQYVIPPWIMLLVIMFVLCYFYRRFKMTTSPDSLWRLL